MSARSASRAAALALTGTLLLAGCSREDLKKLDTPPGGPAHTKQQARIVAGVGTEDAYKDSLKVVKGDVLQFKFNALDGERLSIVLSSRPAASQEALIVVGGKTAARTPLRSADGKPFVVGTATQVTPGRIAVLNKPRPGALELELTLPRLAGEPAGEGPVTYKAVVR